MSTHQNLLRRLRTAGCPPEKVPPGWRTNAQWADLWGLSRPQANRYIRDGVAAGLMQMRRYRVPDSSGRGFPTPHYAEVKQPRT